MLPGQLVVFRLVAALRFLKLIITLEEINMWTVWVHEGRLGEKWAQCKADCCPSRNAEVKNMRAVRMTSQHGN